MRKKKPILTESDLDLLSSKFATKDDLKKLGAGVVSEVNKLLVRQTIRLEGKAMELEDKFEKKVTDLRSDFLNEIDPVLKEVTASREERKILAIKFSEHTDQLEKINKHLGLPTQN